MKSIRDFLAGKLRRAEVEDRLSLDQATRPPHPSLGAFEAALSSPAGEALFYAEGLSLQAVELRYQDLITVRISAPGPDGAQLELSCSDGRQVQIRATHAGALVLHAALRWIGHTQLGRDLCA